MPGFLSHISEAYKRGSQFRFPIYGAQAGNQGGYSALGQWLGRLLPGADFDYVREAQPFHKNAVIAGCLVKSIRLFSQPRLVVYQMDGAAKEKIVPDHPVLLRFHEPNADGDDCTSLLQAWVMDRDLFGTNYWFRVKNGLNQTIGFQHIPKTSMLPLIDTSGVRLIAGFRYFVNGQHIDFTPEEVLQWRLGRNPENIREGLCPLLAMCRDICTENELSTLAASVARNMGIAPYFVTPKVTRDEMDIMPDDVAKSTKEVLNNRTRDQRGLAVVLRQAMQIDRVAFSPQELDSPATRMMATNRICSGMSMDPMVAGFDSDNQTYSNYGEARRAYYEDKVMPDGMAFCAPLTRIFREERQLRPNERLGFDYAQVPAAQEDLNELFKRTNEAFKSGVITQGQACAMIGEPAPKEDGYIWELVPGVKIPGAVLPPTQGSPDEKPNAGGNGTKVYISTGRETKDNWITLDGGEHIDLDNPPPGFNGGNSPSAESKAPTARTKAEIAKASATITDKEVQRYSEEHNEPILAKMVGGQHLNDNQPIDVEVRDSKGNLTHGIELKTMTSNKADKITMSKSAMQRKADWVASNAVPFHTIVFGDKAVFNANGQGKHDDSKREIYYKRGFGSFRISSMQRVSDMTHLNQLMNMAEGDLPKAAAPPKR